MVDADGKPVSGCEAVGVVPRDSLPIAQDSATVSVYGLVPKERRLIVAGIQGRKLVGSLMVTDADKDPVLTLAAGGAVTGQAVDADGKPLAGVTVHLRHSEQEAARVFDLLRFTEQVPTGNDGRFRIEAVIPGHEFRLAFSKGTKNLGRKPEKDPKHTLAQYGDTLKLGDIKLESTKPDGD